MLPECPLPFSKPGCAPASGLFMYSPLFPSIQQDPPFILQYPGGMLIFVSGRRLVLYVHFHRICKMRTVLIEEAIRDLLHLLKMVQQGEDIIIKDDQEQENIAVLMSYPKYRNSNHERPLGILKGVASYKIVGDFEVTNEKWFAV